MNIGTRNGTLKTDWQESFALAKQIGFDGVELDVGADFKDSFLWNSESRKEVVALQQTTGVELPCICIGGLWQHSPANPDDAVRQTAEEFIAGTVRHCAEIGAWVILAPINDAGGQGYEVAMARWVDIMKRVAPVAEECKVCVALENCGCTAAYQLAMVQLVDSPYVQAYYDMANAKVAGDDPVEAIKLLGSSLAQVHAKNWQELEDGQRQPTPLDEGAIDVAACVQALKDVGYDDYVTLETPPLEDAKAQAANNLAFLRQQV